jgi:hypothetical protein
MGSERKSRLERRANCARRSSAFSSPRPQLRDFTIEWGHFTSQVKIKTPGGFVGHRGSVPILRSQPRRLGLGLPLRARPRADSINLITEVWRDLPKPELSTLLGSGTFYFALTERSAPPPPRPTRKPSGSPEGFFLFRATSYSPTRSAIRSPEY